MTWGGIDTQLSELAETPGVSEYQQNTRMVVTGELQRRPGMAPANFSPTGGAAIGMVGAFPTSGAYGCVISSAGSISGFPITGPIWEPPKLKPPIAQGLQWTLFSSGAVPFTDGQVYGAITMAPGGACAGSVTVGLNTLTAGQVTITVNRSGPLGFVTYDTRVFTTGGIVPYNVAVPWSAALPYVSVYYTFAGAGGVDFTASGASTPGCG
jgi:hypothetical protein